MDLAPVPDFLAEAYAGATSITLPEYMAACQRHYYTTRQPIGPAGDFVTAPEVSPMFGEMLGLWALDIWQRLGNQRACLVDMGGGTGQLMVDMLRAIRRVREPALDFIDPYIVDISEPLIKQQKKKLEAFHVNWVRRLENLPDNRPLILIANEFFDALPISQLRGDRDRGWRQRVVYRTRKGLKLDWGPAPVRLLHYLPSEFQACRKVFEHPFAMIEVLKQISERLEKQGGILLMIDYGYSDNVPGETLQAVYKHDYISPLENPGETDITSHVNFKWAQQKLEKYGCKTTDIISQRYFLHNVGIGERLKQILPNLPHEQKAHLLQGYERITAPGQMGFLFHVLAGYTPELFKPNGFGDNV